MSLTFYYSPQSNASRIHWSLKELDIPYKEVRVDLRAGDQRKPEFLALNPNGKVPTIELDGTPMFESVAIQIALGERFGVEKGLWPALNSPEHLTALTWLVWGQVSFATALFRYMTNTSDWFPKDQQNAAQGAAALADLKSLFVILDRQLAGREWISGGAFSLADVDIVSMIGWGTSWIKLDISEYSNVVAYIQRATQRPAAVAAMKDES